MHTLYTSHKVSMVAKDKEENDRHSEIVTGTEKEKGNAIVGARP